MRFRLCLFALFLLALVLPARGARAATPRLRAFWVDAFHPGFKTPQQTDTLLAEATRAGANTLIVQVRRRADGYYRDSAEPVASDVAPGYDPLADLIAKAHARGLKVHGWAVALPIWKDGYVQPDRRHVWYGHGPNAPGAENWMMLRDDGRAGDCGAPDDCGYFLDPGHPAAADYTVGVLLRLIARYDLDGLQLDYIRYPSARFGYNPVSLQRFQQATGRGDRPAPNDPQWMQWRRDQVTKLVKRIYLNMLAQKPAMELSVAAIAWGEGPPNGDWKASSPYTRTLQDWATWLDNGYVDWVAPMMYSRESDATQRGWYDGWLNWIKAHPRRGAIAVGVGSWLNDSGGNMAQLRRATDDGALLGASLYSYSIPATGNRIAFFDRVRAELWSDAAPAPTFPSKSAASTGFVLGRITGSGAALSNATLRLQGPGGTTRYISSDGSGVWGDVGLAPGDWSVTASDPRTNTERTVPFTVAAGRVSHVTLEVAAAVVEPWTPAQPDRAFGELWNRTDLAVAGRTTQRSWMWGPKSFGTGSESYRESPGGRRVVQYWDKSRMEVSNPGANRSELWFVTNGLLTKELISGKWQVGEREFQQQAPSLTPVAGDPVGGTPAPSYAAFAAVASLDGDRRAEPRVGATVVNTIDGGGNAGANDSFRRYNVVNAEYNPELGHNIPGVFRGYLGALPLPWVFVMGYPITEAYWTQATVAGQTRDVLVQMYERRVLTYTPSNPVAFRVEMGNVGQHYYRWRYNAAPWE